MTRPARQCLLTGSPGLLLLIGGIRSAVLQVVATLAAYGGRRIGRFLFLVKTRTMPQPRLLVVLLGPAGVGLQP